MTALYIIPVILLTVTLLIRARFRENDSQIYVLKPLSTVLVIVVALLSLGTPNAQPAFTWWVVAGLVLSLGGDVALMFNGDKWFLGGLVLFLLAHVVYAIGFTLPNGFHPEDLFTAVVLLAVAGGLYLYLRPGLGRMRLPVIIYMLVIMTMVNRALSAFFGTALGPVQAWLLSAGAILFAFSDVLLAINRFRRPFRAQALGLYAYYGGQLLIALSASYFS